jgi:hypothetical protein
MIMGTTPVVHYFLFGGVVYREDGLIVMSWWCFVCRYKE